jgi:hypothetical protein
VKPSERCRPAEPGKKAPLYSRIWARRWFRRALDLTFRFVPRKKIAQLKALRELAGIGHTEMGRRYGSVAQVIRKLEATEDNAALATIFRYVEALGYELEVRVHIAGHPSVDLDWSSYAAEARKAVLDAKPGAKPTKKKR